MAGQVKLCSGEKVYRDNINEWVLNASDLKDNHKSCFLTFNVLTNNHGVVGAKNLKDTRYGTKHF